MRMTWCIWDNKIQKDNQLDIDQLEIVGCKF